MTNGLTYCSQKVQSVQVKAMLAGREGQPAVVVAQPEELPAIPAQLYE